MCVGRWERESWGGLWPFSPFSGSILNATLGWELLFLGQLQGTRHAEWASGCPKAWRWVLFQIYKDDFLASLNQTGIWRLFWWTFLISVGFPCGSAGKESSCNTGDLGLIPGLGRSPGEGKDYPLQYSGLEKSMDYIYIVHGVVKSRIRLSDFHFTLLFSKPYGRRWPTGRWVAVFSS